MTKPTLKIALLATAGSLFASAAWASPVALTDTQLDAVAAGGTTSGDEFVCPVIPTENVTNSENGEGIFLTGELAGGEYYTLAPEGALSLTVPLQATNGGDGSTSPGGTFTAPGDPTYTAIWPGN